MAVIVPTLRYERRLWNDGPRPGRRRGRGRRRADLRRGRRGGRDHAAGLPSHPRASATRRPSRPAQRERLAPLIRARAVAVGVGAASVREIDQLNIYHATHLAMRRAIARVGGHEHVLVDGNRIAGFEAQVGPYTNIVDGDAKVYSIACASVVAKVVRDRMMARLALRYPGYGWEHNQGYATRDHRDAIRALGLTPFHRRSFLALQRTLAGRPARLRPARRPVRVARDPRPARARARAGHGRRRGARRRSTWPRWSVIAGRELAAAAGERADTGR